jgi:hypothetical protein
MVRFGRVRKDYVMADPEMLRKYTKFADEIALIDKKFDELMSEIGKAAKLLEDMGLSTDATKLMYEKTKAWDIRNEITKVADGDSLSIIAENLGLYSTDISAKGPYRYG